MKLTEKEAELLIEKDGWYTLWSDDYWVHNTIMAGANLDYCGVSLKSALTIYNRTNNTNYTL